MTEEEEAAAVGGKDVHGTEASALAAQQQALTRINFESNFIKDAPCRYLTYSLTEELGSHHTPRSPFRYEVKRHLSIKTIAVREKNLSRHAAATNGFRSTQQPDRPSLSKHDAYLLREHMRPSPIQC